jgi:hypothetical protein
MWIGKQESLWLLEYNLVKISQIFSKVWFFITSNKTNSVNIITCCESCKSCKWLLSRTTETDKESTTFWESNNSMNLCDME